jgi:hypothetical protein
VSCVVITWLRIGGGRGQTASPRALVAAERAAPRSSAGCRGGRLAARPRPQASGLAARYRPADRAGRGPALPEAGRLRPVRLPDLTLLQVEDDPKAGVDAATGPTGAPWLDSNGWYVRLARSLANPRTLWLAFDPADIGQPQAATSYMQAIADTEAHGARWMVSLDPHLRVGLLDGRASTQKT